MYCWKVYFAIFVKGKQEARTVRNMIRTGVRTLPVTLIKQLSLRLYLEQLLLDVLNYIYYISFTIH